MTYDRSDAFIAKAGITKGGGQCNKARGWYGVKGNCVRKKVGKGGDRSGAEREALKEFADKQRAGKTFAQSPKVESEIQSLRKIGPKTKLTAEKFIEEEEMAKKARKHRFKNTEDYSLSRQARQMRKSGQGFAERMAEARAKAGK
jgi:hypothetical protein